LALDDCRWNCRGDILDRNVRLGGEKSLRTQTALDHRAPYRQRHWRDRVLLFGSQASQGREANDATYAIVIILL